MMYRAINSGDTNPSTNDDKQRVAMARNVNVKHFETPLSSILFVLYIWVVNFFMLNLFTGATYSNYLKEAEDRSDSIGLTKAQRQWMVTAELLSLLLLLFLGTAAVDGHGGAHRKGARSSAGKTNSSTHS